MQNNDAVGTSFAGKRVCYQHDINGSLALVLAGNVHKAFVCRNNFNLLSLPLLVANQVIQTSIPAESNQDKLHYPRQAW